MVGRNGSKCQARWNEQEAKCPLLQYKHKTEREEEVFETLNIQIQPPGMYLFQQGYTTYTSPKEHHPQGTKCSNTF